MANITTQLTTLAPKPPPPAYIPYLNLVATGLDFVLMSIAASLMGHLLYLSRLPVLNKQHVALSPAMRLFVTIHATIIWNGPVNYLYNIVAYLTAPDMNGVVFDPYHKFWLGMVCSAYLYTMWIPLFALTLERCFLLFCYSSSSSRHTLYITYQSVIAWAGLAAYILGMGFICGVELVYDYPAIDPVKMATCKSVNCLLSVTNELPAQYVANAGKIGEVVMSLLFLYMLRIRGDGKTGYASNMVGTVTK